jgi:hypothetical protein
MENISLKIQAYLGKEFNDDEVKLQDDGSGPYIAFWSDSLAKSKPTDDALNALSSEANTLKNNRIAISNRLSEYPSLGDMIDAICKKEAGDSTEFDSLATKRAATKSKFPKS